MGRILDEGYTLVGNVEENDGGTDYGAGADNLSVQNVADAYKGKDQHLLEDALEANCRGQFLIDNGAHDAGDVVDDHKGQKCIQQPITSSQEPSEPTAYCGKRKLNGRLKFLHSEILLCVFNKAMTVSQVPSGYPLL